MEKRSKVLVAGAAGFIGANLLERLSHEEVSLRASYHIRPPLSYDKRVEYVKADLTEYEVCERVVRGMDYVFICAASTSGAATISSAPLVHVTPNIVMNSRILEASYRAGVRKCVWISSSVGYPPSGERPVAEDEFFEDNPPDVYFPSGWMKRYTEILCRMYSEKLDRRMPIVVLRPSNIYGPYDKFDPSSSHVTAALIRKVVERQDPVVVWGDGKDLRDVIFIDDFIDAVIIATDKINSYEPLNIARGETYSVNEILEAILKIDGYEDAHIVHDASKPSMIPIRRIDVQKAERLLGFRARTELKTGLTKTLSWYRRSHNLGPRLQ